MYFYSVVVVFACLFYKIIISIFRTKMELTLAVFIPLKCLQHGAMAWNMALALPTFALL